MAAARLGRRQEADAAVNAILALDPGYGDHVVADLRARNLHPDLIRIVVEALHEAGLPGSETGSAKTGDRLVAPHGSGARAPMVVVERNWAVRHSE